MKMMFALIAALTVSAPALAQNAAAPEAVPAPASIPASPAASAIAAQLFPDGTYRKLLGPQFTQMMSSMTGSMGAVPIGPILKAAGLDESRGAALDKVTVQQIMDIMDPVFKQRMDLMMTGMFTEMVPLFEAMEPDLRDGLALSLQSRFTQPQLVELKAFFATPTGNAFASQQMLLFMDPAVMGKMQAQMPKIMEAMPTLIAKSMKAMEALPKPKQYKDLTKDERARLAALLGIDPKKMK
jgi:Uncharacterized protein conserved in bacteria (DUF2059)